MADKTIGDLNPVPGSINDSNTLFVVQQTGAAYKVAGSDFITALTAILDGHGGVKSVTYTPPVAPSLTGTMVVTLADNTSTSVSIQNGKGISTITDYWARSSSNSTVPSTWYNTMQTMTTTYKYLWHYQTIAYNDGTSTDTTKTVIGVYGNTGAASYVWIRYANSCSGTPPLPASDSDMGTTPDNWMGIYSGTSSSAPTTRSSYAWFQIKGATGNTGAAASLTSASIEYQTSSSGTVTPTGAWSSSVPTVTQGNYLWTRTTLTFNTGSPVVSYAVAYVGVDGTGSPATSLPVMDSSVGAIGSDTSHFACADHSHPADTSKADKSAFKAFTVTLASASWSSKAQTVSNANFVNSGYAYEVSPASASFVKYGEAQIYADDVSTTGQMTFHCENVPDSNLTVNVVRVVAS